MIMDKALQLAKRRKQDILTVENLFEVLQTNPRFISSYNHFGGNIDDFGDMLEYYFDDFVSDSREEKRENPFPSESNTLIALKQYVSDKASVTFGRITLAVFLMAVYESMDAREYAVQSLIQCANAKDNSILRDMANYLISNGDLIMDFSVPSKKANNMQPPMQNQTAMIISIGGPQGIPGMQVIPMQAFEKGVLRAINPMNGQPMEREQTNEEVDENKSITEIKLGDWAELVVDVRKRATTAKFSGRQDKIQEIVDVLCRKDKGNAIIIGEPGVGKSAIINGFANFINMNNGVPHMLQNVDIVELDTGDLLRDTKYRGELESKFIGLLEHLEDMAIETGRSLILCIDEIHTLMGAGESSNSNMDGSSILKRFITEGNIKVIGCTTHEEYRNYVEKRKAFCRRFKNIKVEETTIDETVSILNDIKNKYEEYHGVQFKPEAITACATLASKYIKERFLPDKAIDLMDSCGAYVVSHGLNDRQIGTDVVESVISTICKIPKDKIEENNVEKLRTLGDEMKKRVFGQDEAINHIVRAIRASEAGLNDENKPVANLLFVGPTGTGKTETVKALAETLGINMIKLDMSEYSDDTAVNKMIGTGQGYVGYEEGGYLINEVRKNPYSVVLLDEIEKANPKVFDVLLGAMDDGRMTDNKGNIADFNNVILIMTSNVGASKIGSKKLGFNSNGQDDSVGYEAIEEEMKKVFKPEFRNRLTGTVMFHGINKEMALRIAKKLIDRVMSRASAKGVSIAVEEGVYSKIAECGTSLETGARSMERYINDNIKPLLSDFLLFEVRGDKSNCRLVLGTDGKFEFIKE